MTPEELEAELKKVGLNYTIDELLAMSEDELLVILAQVAEQEGQGE